ncbi:acetate uptake transporter family protein [Streptomyces sp. NBC_01239]|uniref:GPR1/FUN34/YaaH family transporter n=1 Tax=Streptomyces sp. NBC_01239 TaxID=2903792 RepID=UPI002250DC1B|nr:GPR1/FUN34/YaaH family transporter [Streptomyces sp. NBC_01239]MCX4817355.1 acetate uptake transporter family protein [Streptomyces sp. NBC_01239]
MAEVSLPAAQSPPVRAVTTSHIGHATAVGAAGFAWCSLILGLHTAGIIDAADGTIVLAGTFFYGGIVQLVAGFFALASGATFAAAFLTAYGAFWLGYTVIEFWAAPHIAGAAAAAAKAGGASAEASAAAGGHAVMQSLGLFLIGWLVVTLVFGIASLGTNGVIVSAFALLTLTIVLLVTAYLGASSAGVPSDSVLKTAGYVEIVLAAVAFYLVLAELTNDIRGRAVLPLFALNRAPQAAAQAA